MTDETFPCVVPGRTHTGFVSGSDPVTKCEDCMSPDCPDCGVRGVEGAEGIWYCDNRACENYDAQQGRGLLGAGSDPEDDGPPCCDHKSPPLKNTKLRFECEREPGHDDPHWAFGGGTEERVEWDNDGKVLRDVLGELEGATNGE